MKENKGITLIALVITIIIMLILAGVSIGLVFNGGLIDYARNAKENTQQRIEEEQKIAEGKEIQIGDKSIKEILKTSNYKSSDYILAAYNTNNKILYNQYFCVTDGRNTWLRNFIDVNISTAEDIYLGKATSWEDFNENSTARCGYLCDIQGNTLLGFSMNNGEPYEDTSIAIEITDYQSNSYIAYEEYLGANEYITYREFLENNNIENDRIGTEIDETGTIWAKYSNGDKNKVGKIATINDVIIPNSLEMIDENLFQTTRGSGDSAMMAVFHNNVNIKKVDLNTANEIIYDIIAKRTTEYRLAIEGNDNLYFVTYNGNTGEYEFNKDLAIYSTIHINRDTGVAYTTNLSPFNEENPPILLDRNGYSLLGWKANEDFEIIPDVARKMNDFYFRTKEY